MSSQNQPPPSNAAPPGGAGLDAPAAPSVKPSAPPAATTNSTASSDAAIASKQDPTKSGAASTSGASDGKAGTALAAVPSNYSVSSVWNPLLAVKRSDGCATEEGLKFRWKAAARDELFDEKKGDNKLEGGRAASFFISYARSDKQAAKNVYDSLAIDDRRIWVDWEDIPYSADWKDEVVKGIEMSDCVVILASPELVAGAKADQNRWEITEAIKLNKRLIPVQLSAAVEPKHFPKEIANLQWIDMTGEKNAIPSLKAALDVDYYHVHYHTVLTQRAVRWRYLQQQQNAKVPRTPNPKSVLLNKRDTELARRFKDRCAQGYTPQLAELHVDFINASEADSCVIM